jgi:large subunit ribosomal protein L21e
MINRKQLRAHGKIKLSNYFKDFKEDDKVAVVMELAVQPKFPKKLQGRCGVIVGKRGHSYVIKMNDLNKEKTYIIHPLHLRKLK